MPKFRSDTGAAIDVPFGDLRTRKQRVIEKDGIKYKRVPKPKPLSRSQRRDLVVGAYQDFFGELEELVDDEHQWHTNKEGLEERFNNMDSSGLEELKDELQEWVDSMPENLQQSDKAYQLEEAISLLESAQEYLGYMEFPAEYDELESFMSEIENGISSAEEVEFPPMFG